MKPLSRGLTAYLDEIPGGRVTAGVVLLLVAVAAIGLYATLGSGDDEVSLQPGPDDTPFYIEALVVVFAPAEDGGTRPEEANSTVQWWYIRPSLWRWQIDTQAGEEEPRSLTGVADGRYVWVHDSDTETYTRVSLKDNPSTVLPSAILLGPIDVIELTERWLAQGISVRSGGAGRHLARETQVIEYSPTWTSSGSAAGTLSGGIGRIWIDDETGLVVRNLVDNGAAHEYVDARVTLLDLAPAVDRSLFRFVIPEGSNRVDAN